jgi:hypothetical protein
VPRLYAEDIDNAKKNMLGDMAKLHANILRINKNFFVPEHTQRKDADALLKKPREGAVLYSFKWNKWVGPAEDLHPVDNVECLAMSYTKS